MDDTISKPVAVFYAGSKGGWRSVEELFDKLRKVGYCNLLRLSLSGIQHRLCILLACECCLRERALCDECKGAGLKNGTCCPAVCYMPY